MSLRCAWCLAERASGLTVHEPGCGRPAGTEPLSTRSPELANLAALSCTATGMIAGGLLAAPASFLVHVVVTVLLALVGMACGLLVTFRPLRGCYVQVGPASPGRALGRAAVREFCRGER